MTFYDQHGFAARFEWGPEGARRLLETADVIVVVDVLSSTTCISIGVERGAVVHPYPFKDASAASFAASLGASLAVHREDVNDEHPFSLSPASFLGAERGQRIVLPSPNGAVVALAAAERDKPVLAGCLRNATAVARAAESLGGSVAIIAAGERWFVSDDSLRPAFEDHAGAGAILATMSGRSPEADAAVAVFESARDNIAERLATCASGRELSERGFEIDAALAAELDVSPVVPVLRDRAFVEFQSG